MKVLLDTNIIICREGSHQDNENIGRLYYWLDKLHYDKYVHYRTLNEIEKYYDQDVKNSFKRKLQSYNQIVTKSVLDDRLSLLSKRVDKNENDLIDTELLNEVMLNHVDFFITEDRGIRKKAKELGIGSRVVDIFEYLEKLIAENPSLTEPRIKNVRLEKFGAVDVNQTFFHSLESNYAGFEEWFQKKFDEEAYVCGENDEINAFLYLKTEEQTENYHDIEPRFLPKRRLKIGTFKVIANGYRIGERFIKIICDNAVKRNVDEIYVTIFDDEESSVLLVSLLEKFGFTRWGTKGLQERKETVYVKPMDHTFNQNDISACYPYLPTNRRAFFVAIDPMYHTKLFPDSILNNENPDDFSEQAGFSNAVRKCYITRSYSVMPKRGDILVFYRTGGRYVGVFTTLGVFEGHKEFKDFGTFYEYASNRTVLSRQEMLEWWNKGQSKPKIIDFIYSYSFPKRINLQQMISLGFDEEIMGKGIQQLSQDIFTKLIQQSKMDVRYFADGRKVGEDDENNNFD